MINYVWLIPLAGLAALGYAFLKSAWINRQDSGTEKMKTIAAAIREGAMAFLMREYRILAVFVIVVAALLGWVNRDQPDSHQLIALSFVVGAVCSGLAGFFGMRVATAANVRTTNRAREGLAQALDIAFGGGAVMGMSVVGLGVLGLGGLFLLYNNTHILGMAPGSFDVNRVLNVLAGFSLGASSIALFARVGGGIFTKAADVGADLVGKVEAGIPEDDPRNPATIADNVGDNVGDVAGMGADLFESYVGAIIGSMVLGVAWGRGLEGQASFNPIILPLFIAAAGIIVSIAGTFVVKTKEGGNPQAALDRGTFGAGAVMLVVSYFLIHAFLGEGTFNFNEFGVAHTFTAQGVFYATLGGLVAGILIGVVTEYYTSDHKSPVHGIARESLTGPSTNIISGLAVGMLSTAIPTLLISGAIMFAYANAGLYGIAMAALGMLSTTGIQLAVDAYGPIADNAGGIAEMAGLEAIVRERTDKLDAVGNTTAAIGKGFAIGSAALTALALFSAFATKAGLLEHGINVLEPSVMAGVFIGGMLPFLFSAMAMKAVGRAAFKMIEEVRRQFREIPGIREGTTPADHARCVDISTAAAIKEMIIPGLLAILAPVAMGFYSAEALGGLLVGTTVGGVMLAIFMSNAGGAWDNAKKYIEGGHHGGKGSEAHKAAVIGDTVGDPFKDTAGPALNILIKLMSVVALVIAPLI
ncbi:sodium-translocating pyrophosphatase [Myxococcota bacterium]|nr:sodium-translocating pyrophosphatase [Myxococcota bacterium]MBU1431380.1 sodium-translocating pyrophosphatase [Myxococcota bacterium]MBU1896966.1 sodium-translocating pyrophosphatase [Myxococcota bacterium]